MYMKWNVRKNLNYLLLMTAMCSLIPHAVLAIVQAKVHAETMIPARAENIILFFICEWTPFWAVFIAYLRQEKMDDASLLPMLGFAAVIASCVPVCEKKQIMVLVLTIPLLLTVECFAFLKRWDDSKNVLLKGIAANRSLQRAFFFWSVAIFAMIHIACAPFRVTVVNPLPFLPVAGILVAVGFRKLNNLPPTMGGIAGLVVLMTVSLILATSGPMAFYKQYFIAIILCGYGAFFLLQIIYHMDHWRNLNRIQ